MVTSHPADNPVVPAGTEVVGAAGTTIVEAGLAALRYAAQVEVRTGPGLGAECLHHRPPFPAVWTYARQTIQAVSNVVCHFMRDSHLQAMSEMAREDIRVVADHRLPTRHAIHAGSAPVQIEVQGDRPVLEREELLGPPQTRQRRRTHVLTLACVDGTHGYGGHSRKKALSPKACWH